MHNIPIVTQGNSFGHAGDSLAGRRCGALRVKTKATRVNIHNFACLDVLRIVDSSRSNVPRLTGLECDGPTVLLQSTILLFGEELNLHLALHHNCGIIARMRVRRFGRPRFPFFQNCGGASGIRGLVPGRAQCEA